MKTTDSQFERVRRQAATMQRVKFGGAVYVLRQGPKAEEASELPGPTAAELEVLEASLGPGDRVYRVDRLTYAVKRTPVRS